MLYLTPLYRWENKRKKKLTNLPEVTQLVKDGAGLEPRTFAPKHWDVQCSSFLLSVCVCVL